MGQGADRRRGEEPAEDAGDGEPEGRRATKRRTRVRTATWGIVAGILIATVTDSLTGVLTTGLRTVWSRVAAEDPIVVHSTVLTSECGESWVVPAGRTAPPAPDPRYHSNEEVRAWAREAGAVEAGDTKIQLTIRGGSSNAVVLQELRVRAVGQDPPVRGTAQNGAPCGGPLGIRPYAVNLDDARPVAVAVLRPPSDFDDDAPVSFPYKVTHADPEVIRLVASTDRCDCRWIIELVYVDGDEQHVMRIDNAGKPFRTTALPESAGSGDSPGGR